MLVLLASLSAAAVSAAGVKVQASLDLNAETTPFPHYWKRCFGGFLSFAHCAHDCLLHILYTYTIHVLFDLRRLYNPTLAHPLLSP